MKKIILFSIMLITIAMMQIAFAESVTPEGYYQVDGMTYKLDSDTNTAITYIYGDYLVDGEKEIWSYNTSTAEVIVPAAITVDETEYAVTKIGEYTFGAPKNTRGHSAATQNQAPSITLPEGITELGTYSFYNCKKLNSIVIPTTVTTLGDSVFSGCGVLKEIDLLLINLCLYQLILVIYIYQK